MSPKQPDTPSNLNLGDDNDINMRLVSAYWQGYRDGRDAALESFLFRKDSVIETEIERNTELDDTMKIEYGD